MVPLGRWLLKLWAINNRKSDALTMRMLDFYFETDTKLRKPDEKFEINLQEMKDMVINIPSKGGVKLDRNNWISLTSYPGWADKAEKVIDTGVGQICRLF